MVKSVKKLKAMISNDTELRTKSGSVTKIKRYPNNIIKLYGRSITWKTLYELIYTGDYQVLFQGKPNPLFDMDFVKSNHGGVRVPGPGKTLGRNKINPTNKRKIKSFSLSPDSIQIIETESVRSGMSQSEYIDYLILFLGGNMNDKAKTNECPYCWGNGFLFRPGAPLVDCPECSGTGILSDS